MSAQPPFMTAVAIADCAAQLLVKQRTKAPAEPEPCAGYNASDRRCRMFLRQNPVATLRWLWATGDQSQRACVAARIAVWMDFDKSRISAINSRVYDREKARLAQHPLQEAA